MATKRIKETIASQKPKYIIRADIKSYYKSIQHHILLQDIKRHYGDPNLHVMLENIVKNPIETPRGYKNPDNGIALWGSLSQFFSALYLKPLDDAFDTKDVTYIRYQDDIIILCQTKRQLERCKQRLMDVLQERRLQLSRKKTRIGSLDKGFHFLGINYLETQPPSGINVTQVFHDPGIQSKTEHCLNSMGCGGDSSTVADHSVFEQKCIVPHARSIRNACEQVKQMVASGVSLQRIKRYLLGWCRWWMQTAECWSGYELLTWFLDVCRDKPLQIIALAARKTFEPRQNVRESGRAIKPSLV